MRHLLLVFYEAFETAFSFVFALPNRPYLCRFDLRCGATPTVLVFGSWGYYLMRSAGYELLGS